MLEGETVTPPSFTRGLPSLTPALQPRSPLSLPLPRFFLPHRLASLPRAPERGWLLPVSSLPSPPQRRWVRPTRRPPCPVMLSHALSSLPVLSTAQVLTCSRPDLHVPQVGDGFSRKQIL